MAREIDERKKRNALRKLRKAAERAKAEGGPGLSDWEEEFVEEVDIRIETYGSAFADPDKGRLEEPLSARQAVALNEIDKKSRGQKSGKKSGMKRGNGFKRKGPPRKSYARDINDDLNEEKAPVPEAPKPSKPKLVRGSDLQPKTETPPPEKPAQSGSFKLRVIQGGADE